MRKIRFILVLFVILALGFSSCIRSGAGIRVPVDVPRAFPGSGSGGVPDQWWTVFGDHRLNSIVSSALDKNFDIRTAWYRMKAARASAWIGAAPLFPTLEAEISGDSSRAETGNSREEELELDLRVGYEVDLWGKIRSEASARRYEARAAATDYQTAGLTVSSEIVLTWIRMIGVRNQIRILEEQIRTNEKMLILIRARAGTGQVRGVDLLRQQRLIESTREQLIASESRLEVLGNTLTVLTGGGSRGMAPVESRSIPRLPPLPETGIPSELVKRRPDVKSAYFRLRAADHELGASVRSLYPRLSIRAGWSSTAHDGVSILRDWARNLVGNLLAPLFQGGKLRAQVRRSRAIREQLLMEYGNVVLNAVREVEDALAQERNQTRLIRNLEKQLKLQQITREQLRAEYFNGMSDYLDVLTVMREEQQLRREVLSAYLQRLEYRVALYRALAGGFKIDMESKNE